MEEKEQARELMLRLQKGDENAFTEIVVSHERLVLNFAYRYLGDERKAEDVAQETFMRVFKARHKWRPQAAFRTWLLTITTRLCLNEIRSQKRERRVLRRVTDSADGDFWANAEDTKGPSPAEHVIARERAELVHGAIAELSESQRTALLLHRFEGLSYKEVAQVMDLTLEAVRSLLVRARKNLRRHLAPLLGAERPLSEGARTQ
jgi:RNA polymerase sigma-70 factor (ECF subfamily)